MSYVHKQRVIESIEGYLEEERGHIPEEIEAGLERVHNSLQAAPDDGLSPGQMATVEVTNGTPTSRYPHPFEDKPSPGELEVQALSQNK